MKKIVSLTMIFILMFSTLNFDVSKVSAEQIYTTWIPITTNNQVVDSLSYNGKTINAIYPLTKPENTDETYACFAYVMKFYKAAYGITVYNMWGPSYTPLASSGSFSKTSNPRVGDIIRFQNYTHWAIVKSIDETGTVIVIQQNVRWNESAPIGAYIKANDDDVTYFTYSGYVPPVSEEPPTNPVITISSNTIENGKNFTFNFSAKNAKYYAIRIDKNESAFEIKNCGTNAYYTRMFSEPGEYSACVTAWNDYGAIASEKVSFLVIDNGIMPESIELDKTEITLKTTQTIQMSANILPETAGNKTLTWSSDNTQIAEVSSLGKITAKTKGEVTITATTVAGLKKAECKVTVVQPVKSIILNKKYLTIKRGKTYRLIATINPKNASNTKVKWKSFRKEIATVTYKGLVRAVKKGNVYIKVYSVDGKKSASCRVTVK